MLQNGHSKIPTSPELYLLLFLNLYRTASADITDVDELRKNFTSGEKVATTGEQKLLYHLMENYDPRVRPSSNITGTIEVKLGLSLINILEIDEKNQVLVSSVWLDQEWNDEFLQWDPSEFENISAIRVPCEIIWTPDITLYNNADDYLRGYFPSRAMVHSDGNVFWPPPTHLRSTCMIDVRFFPFDIQYCYLKFGSWTYDGFELSVINRSVNVDLENYIVSGEFDLVKVHQLHRITKYPCCPEPYSDVIFFLRIKRKVLYYVTNIVMPCIVMSSLMLLVHSGKSVGLWVFILPPDSGEKIALGITVLLAFYVFNLTIAEKMPATSDSIPLIGIYLTVTMGLSGSSVTMTVLVLSLHHRGPFLKSVPRWVRWLVLNRIRKILRLSEQDINQTRPKAKYQKMIPKDILSMLKRNSCARTESPMSFTNPAFEHFQRDVTDGKENEVREEALKKLHNLIGRQDAEDESEEIIAEWRQVALVTDRCFFWGFLIITIGTTVSLLILAPLYQDVTVNEDFDLTQYRVPR